MNILVDLGAELVHCVHHSRLRFPQRKLWRTYVFTRRISRQTSSRSSWEGLVWRKEAVRGKRAIREDPHHELKSRGDGRKLLASGKSSMVNSLFGFTRSLSIFGSQNLQENSEKLWSSSHIRNKKIHAGKKKTLAATLSFLNWANQGWICALQGEMGLHMWGC